MFGAFSNDRLGLGIGDLDLHLGTNAGLGVLGADELAAQVLAHPINLAFFPGLAPAGGGREMPPVMAVLEDTAIGEAGASVAAPAAIATVTMDDVRAGTDGTGGEDDAASDQTASLEGNAVADTADGNHSELSYDLAGSWPEGGW